MIEPLELNSPVALANRIAELEEERDIFKRTLDKRDAECARLAKTIVMLEKAADRWRKLEKLAETFKTCENAMIIVDNVEAMKE